MIQRIVYLVMVGVTLVVASVSAQETKRWSLKDCISYALDNNIQLQQRKLVTQECEVDVQTARASLFPSLSFSTNQNLTHRPFQENSRTVSGTEIITSDKKSTYNGNYGLNAQWVIWDGNQRKNTLKLKKKSQQIAQLEVGQAANTLQEQIAQLYVQILYAYESVQTNRQTLEVSQATCDRAKVLFQEGSLSKADCAQLEAQVSSDQYQLVTAENALRSYRLQLKQLLELSPTVELELAQLSNTDTLVLRPLPTCQAVYQQALAVRPEILGSEQEMEQAKVNIAVAKGAYLPTLSLSASMGSMTNSGSSQSWAKQMQNAWNNSIGLTLSIPIFDNRQRKSTLQKARLQYGNSQLEYANQQKELYTSIENLWMEASNAQQQYRAAESKLASCRSSYEMVSEQFDLGMKNTVELLTEKNNLLSAQQARLQAKYLVILNQALLSFYAGEKMSL